MTKKRDPNLLCSIEDCPKPARTRGWCAAHYEHWRKYGDPLAERYVGSKTSHCPKGHEYTEENTGWRSSSRTLKDGTVKTFKAKHCLACGRESSKKYREEHPELNSTEQSKISQKKLRLEALEAYGNKCSCCGESTFEFLHFDHVNNDGAQQRRELNASKSNSKILRWARDNGWPNSLQILCHNCGMAKAFYGRCPHEQH